VKHPSGAPPYALRFDIDGKILPFTGDTGWVEVLCEVARGADLFITQCCSPIWERPCSPMPEMSTVRAISSRKTD
jgi:hypothetical protein